jgi:hypothetical protein
VRPPEKARSKKSLVYKSAAVIASSSSSDSDPGYSQSTQLCIQQAALAKSPKRVHASFSHGSPTAGNPNCVPTSKKRPKMIYDRRANGNTFKQSSTAAQKRLRSPTAVTANKKRQHKKGGFLVDDSESEAEEQHNQTKDEGDSCFKSVCPKPVPKQPPVGRRHESKPISIMQHSLGLEPGQPPLPTKQVNRNRINALPGKNKGVQNRLKQRSQLGQVLPKNTKLPVPALPGLSPACSAYQHHASAKQDNVHEEMSQEQGSTKIHQNMKEMEGLNQGSTTSKSQGLSHNSNGKASPGRRDAERPVILERRSNHAASPTQAGQASVSGITAAPSKPRYPQIQQSKPVPSTNGA